MNTHEPKGKNFWKKRGIKVSVNLVPIRYSSRSLIQARKRERVRERESERNEVVSFSEEVFK